MAPLQKRLAVPQASATLPGLWTIPPPAWGYCRWFCQRERETPRLRGRCGLRLGVWAPLDPEEPPEITCVVARSQQSSNQRVRSCRPGSVSFTFTLSSILH